MKASGGSRFTGIAFGVIILLFGIFSGSLAGVGAGLFWILVAFIVYEN